MLKSLFGKFSFSDNHDEVNKVYSYFEKVNFLT